MKSVMVWLGLILLLGLVVCEETSTYSETGEPTFDSDLSTESSNDYTNEEFETTSESEYEINSTEDSEETKSSQSTDSESSDEPMTQEIEDETTESGDSDESTSSGDIFETTIANAIESSDTTASDEPTTSSQKPTPRPPVPISINCDQKSNSTTCQSELTLNNLDAPDSLLAYLFYFKVPNSDLEIVRLNLSKFVIASPPKSGDAYKVQVDYNLDLDLGTYEIKYGVGMYCPGFECKSASDFLNIFTSASDKGDQVEERSSIIQNLTAQNLAEFNKCISRDFKIQIKTKEEQKFNVN
jgi:hypothetical protein